MRKSSLHAKFRRVGPLHRQQILLFNRPECLDVSPQGEGNGKMKTGFRNPQGIPRQQKRLSDSNGRQEDVQQQLGDQIRSTRNELFSAALSKSPRRFEIERMPSECRKLGLPGSERQRSLLRMQAHGLRYIGVVRPSA